MKIGRQWLGRRVTVTWLDPCTWHEEGEHELGSVRGSGSPPVWTSDGVVADIRDGWVRIEQNRVANATPAASGILVHEDLIQSVRVWTPEGGEATPDPTAA